MADAVGPVATIAANAIATSTIPREEHVLRFGAESGASVAVRSRLAALNRFGPQWELAADMSFRSGEIHPARLQFKMLELHLIAIVVRNAPFKPNKTIVRSCESTA